MANNRTTKLTMEILENHFASELESLPNAAIDQLLEGQDVEFQKVKSASQIDLASAVLVIKTAIDVCKFAYDIYTDQRDEGKRREKIIENIKKKNPSIIDVLSNDELSTLVSDLASLKS